MFYLYNFSPKETMMGKDFDDLYKKIDQSHKDIDKNQDKILKDISDIKKQVKDISNKVDLMLEILNNFTIMLAEEETILDNYEEKDSWVPEQDENWDSYEEEDDQD